MKFSLTLIILMSQWLTFSFSSAERILVLAPVCSKSHKISFMPIVEVLAEKGHQVTVVTPFAPDSQMENIKEIVLDRNPLEELNTNWFQIQNQNALEKFQWTITVFQTAMTEGYIHLMNNQEFKEIVQARAVDFVIVDAILNDFVLPIVEHMNVPYIYYSPASNVPWVMDAFQVPQEYASVPVGMGDGGSQMTFMQRVGNVMAGELFFLLRKVLWLNTIDDLARKDFPNSRPIIEIERDAQLCILNSHPATAWTRPLTQNVIPIPALHTRPAKSLPEVRTLTSHK
jgi:glucuronosyltransferase